MKVIIHKPSGSIYPYTQDQTKRILGTSIYLKGVGYFSIDVCAITNMSPFKFYPLWWYENLITRKKLIYKIISLLPWQIRKRIYKVI